MECKLIVCEAIYEDYTMVRIMHNEGLGYIDLYYYYNNIENFIVQNLYVAEKARNKKIATDLINFCLDFSIIKNAKNLNLYATKGTWMWDWYVKLGFVEDEDFGEWGYTWMIKKLE